MGNVLKIVHDLKKRKYYVNNDILALHIHMSKLKSREK